MTFEDSQREQVEKVEVEVEEKLLNAKSSSFSCGPSWTPTVVSGKKAAAALNSFATRPYQRHRLKFLREQFLNASIDEFPEDSEYLGPKVFLNSLLLSWDINLLWLVA